MSPNTNEQIDALTDFAGAIAREAGELAVSLRQDPLEVTATKSTPYDVATNADVEVERFIRARLLEARPEDAFLGEESEADSPNEAPPTGITWVVDPIDGTTNFLYDLPNWAVSIAAIQGPVDDPTGWNALAAAISIPTLNLHFSAGKRLGTTLNNQPLQTPKPGDPGRVEDLAAALVAVGYHYDPQARQIQSQIAAGLAPRVRDLRDHGATAVELCNVAAGFVDAYWEGRLAPWDVAAGLLIAEEAGCHIDWINRQTPIGTEQELLVSGTYELQVELGRAIHIWH